MKSRFLACLCVAVASACTPQSAGSDASPDGSTLDENATVGDATNDAVTPTDASTDGMSTVDDSLDVPLDPDSSVQPDVITTPDVVVTPSCSLRLQRMNPLATTESVTDLAQGSNRIPNASCATTLTPNGPEAIYQLVVPSRMGLEISTEGASTGTTDTVLSVRRDCMNATSEVACNDDISPQLRASRIRAEFDAGTYYVVIDRAGNTNAFDFNLSVRPYTSQPGEMCAAPIPLPTGTQQLGTVTNGTASPIACVPGANGPQAFYSFTIPAGQRASFTVASVGALPWTPTVRVIDTCTSTTCRASATADSTTTPKTVTADNPGTSPLNLIVSVGGTSSNTTNAFSLLATTAAIPVDNSCTNATALTPGTPLMETLPLGLAPTTTPCVGSPGAITKFYSLSIPAGQTATLNLDGGLMISKLQVFDSCTSTTCGGTMDSTPLFPAEITVPNSTGTTRNIRIAVSTDSAPFGSSYTLRATLGTAAANATCAAPTAITLGATYNNLSPAGGGASLANLCLPSATGQVKYYRMTVPANTRANITAAGAGGFSPVVRVLDACQPTSCLASGTGTANISNTGTTARDYLFAVGGSSTSVSGTYSLVVTTAPITSVPFTLSSSSNGAQCENVGGGIPVPLTPVSPSTTLDDSVSSVMSAGGAQFQFMGTTMSYFSVTSNGFLQLWPSSAGTPSAAYTNVNLPSPTAPGNMIAPFWDDLTVPANETPSVNLGVFGTTGSRRLVVQWTNWSLVQAPSARLTFQVKLFEGTNVIEFHYCSLLNSNSADFQQTNGSSATVGVQNTAGTDGRQAVPTPALLALNTGLMIRFTPN